MEQDLALGHHRRLHGSRHRHHCRRCPFDLPQRQGLQLLRRHVTAPNQRSKERRVQRVQPFRCFRTAPSIIHMLAIARILYTKRVQHPCTLHNFMLVHYKKRPTDEHVSIKLSICCSTAIRFLQHASNQINKFRTNKKKKLAQRIP